MSEFFNNISNSFKESAQETANHMIGKVLINLGSNVERVALIAIVLGTLLLICRYTKVLRWGFISYLLALLVEIIGLALIK